MMIDSNVLIDVLGRDARWEAWSARALSHAGSTAVINHVVFAEVASRFEAFDVASDAIEELGVAVVSLDKAAAFGAGLAFREYRRRGGERTTMIADFLIAGHAASLKMPLVTRDKLRIASYFPELTLITPETDNG